MSYMYMYECYEHLIFFIVSRSETFLIPVQLIKKCSRATKVKWPFVKGTTSQQLYYSFFFFFHIYFQVLKWKTQVNRYIFFSGMLAFVKNYVKKQKTPIVFSLMKRKIDLKIYYWYLLCNSAVENSMQLCSSK